MDKDVQADDRQLAEIVRMVKESVEAGAVGFSTSRFIPHTVPDGRCTPWTWADLRETGSIQQAVIEACGVGFAPWQKKTGNTWPSLWSRLRTLLLKPF